MGNSFMPSALTSLAGASQDTLAQTLAEREFNRKMAEHQQQLQRQALMDQFSVAMRMQDQGQQERAFRYRVDQDTAEAKGKADAAATKQREFTNIRGAQDIFATGVQNGASRQDLMRAAIDGKVPVSMLPKEPVAKLSLAERVADRKALRTADKEVDAKFDKPKATKVAADEIKAPPALRTEIESYASRKLPGWRTVDEAKRSIESNWPKLRATHGQKLDKAAVDRVLVNIYGTRPKGSTNWMDEFFERSVATAATPDE